MTKKGTKEEKKKPRRDYGEGSLTRRKDGRWQGSYYHEGGRRYVYGEVGGTRLEALQILKAAIARAERGDLVPVEKLTVVEYMWEWLQGRPDYRANTRVGIDSIIKNHIVSSCIGNIQVQTLTGRHVQAWVTELRNKKLKPSSIHRFFAMLHTALQDGVKLRVISSNPAQGIALPQTTKKTEQVVLDQEQANLFLKTLEGHGWLRPIIVLALTTGMRKSELLALRWSDIDMKNGSLFVRHNIAMVAHVGVVEGPPKTKASERKIQLPLFALDMLKSHKIEQKVKKLAAGPTWQDHDLVFSWDSGYFIYTKTLDQAFKTAVQKAGVPRVTFHGLRHSAATLLLSMGVPPKVVQEILGHSSILMTMDLYGHVLPHQQLDAANRMNTAFQGENAKNG